jgi:hypothetical protein
VLVICLRRFSYSASSVSVIAATIDDGAVTAAAAVLDVADWVTAVPGDRDTDPRQYE